MRNLVAVLAGIIALSVPSVVFAQMAPDDQRPMSLYTPIGMEGEVGGGVFRFTDTKAIDATGTGGAWAARLVIGTRTHVGGELAYVGAALPMNTLGVDDKAVLTSHGVEGALRFNLLTGSWQPYAIAGVGWRHFSLVNSSFNTSDVKNSDDTAEIPLGIGLAYRNSGFVVDGRAGLNPSLASALIPGASLTSWTVNARVGFEF